MICTSCNQSKQPSEIGTLPSRKAGANGPGYGRKCKLCIAEQVKLSKRTNEILPALKRDVKTWPRVKVESEIAWLKQKLAILRETLRQAG